MFPADVLDWVRVSQPKAWDVLEKRGADAVLDRLRKQIDQRGTLEVLRHGIEAMGLRSPLKLAEFKPAVVVDLAERIGEVDADLAGGEVDDRAHGPEDPRDAAARQLALDKVVP
ncbi:hypothetical protein [Sagittula salina]|uniref:Uncharacterized protein n=1 Tax=Sagittula salina TaxID=2820268 RepID=A0A940S1M3_9RHOB|nr:hypothetical protein [Sagittula salina]MBP0484308.1 hypothetical protein [Sagittula salina]